MPVKKSKTYELDIIDLAFGERVWLNPMDFRCLWTGVFQETGFL